MGPFSIFLAPNWRYISNVKMYVSSFCNGIFDLHCTQSMFPTKGFGELLEDPQEWGVPVMTMVSKGPLNGAKCRPCRAKIRGEEGRTIAETLNRGWSWSGPNEGVELCDATGDWDADWEAVYDNVVGQRGQLERLRVCHLGTLDECVERLTEFERMWGEWDAPSLASICERKFMI
ncbi:hypothetical protein SELMODRAFT_417460 [Selaginella moellendorffii]|uniref:DUF7796 domain-containing protein n=1 Tax=Selaginella moellendorffii TaxID=88036 RepID=D8S2A5_SELML|nr:hypothetical protein SELMODRAFT_417460 [Selaginella moellendorffii]